MRLPSGYQEVEYIQSSGTQYINTGQSFDCQNTIVEMRFQMPDVSYSSLSSRPRFYGVSNGTNEYSLQANRDSITSLSANSYLNNSTYQISATVSKGVDHVSKHYASGVWYVDGVSKGSKSHGDYSTGDNPIFIFEMDSGGQAADRKMILRIYRFKIYNGSTLQRDFIPCYRKSDGEMGLYDLVGNQFYTNQGTGTFTKGPDVGPTGKIQRIYLGTDLIRPKYDVYYSDKNREEYQSLVNSVGSVQFVDTGRRYRFGGNCCYIGNRIAVNITGGTNFNKVNLDTLTVVSTTTISMSIGLRIWYFGDNRILTRSGILDFDGNVITDFGTTYTSITPGLTGVVWANNGFDIYKGIVDGDNITFTKIGTSPTDQSAGQIQYGRLGAYLFNGNDNSGSGNSAYVNPETNAISTVAGGSSSRQVRGVAGADGKEYRAATRYNGWGKLQKVGTASEGFVGNSLSTSWTSYGVRFGKFLGNIVSGGMNSNNGTGNGYGSNSYFIGTDGTLTLAQSNAFAYDTSIFSGFGFIDENGRIYPNTSGGGTGVILKTNKTFTDLNWRNPFLWR